MKRHLFRLGTLFSLALFEAVAVLWLCSMWDAGSAEASVLGARWRMKSDGGILTIEIVPRTADPTKAGAAPAFSLWLPHAVPAALFAAAPGLWLVRTVREERRSRPRRQPRRCPDCGYDLRAAGHRCPECGRHLRPLVAEMRLEDRAVQDELVPLDPAAPR